MIAASHDEAALTPDVPEGGASGPYGVAVVETLLPTTCEPATVYIEVTVNVYVWPFTSPVKL